MLNTIFIIARFVVLEAYRSRQFIGFGLAVFVGLVFADFLSQLAITETQEHRIAFSAALLRYLAVITTIAFVLSSHLREINDKGMELILAQAIPRVQYYLGRLLGYSLISVIFATIVMVGLLLCGANWPAILFWTLSLFLELLMICCFSLFCVASLGQFTSSLLVVSASYLLARSLAAIQLIATSPMLDSTRSTQTLVNWLINALSLLFPDLHRYTSADWLIYSNVTVTELGQLVIQAIIYCSLLIAAGLFDFYRKSL